MRVVFITHLPPPLYSGSGRGALNQARFLRDKGTEVTILGGRFSREIPEYETIDGVPIRRVPHNLTGRLGKLVFYYCCALWLYQNRQKYDVVHFCEIPVYWYPVFIVAKALKKPVFVTMTLYGSDDLESISRNRLGALHLFFLRRVEKILAISKNLIEASQKHVLDKTLITDMTYPLDICLFRPAHSIEERDTLRAKFGIFRELKVVIFSGSVLHRKGVDLLVEAWPKIVDRAPNAILYVAGPRTFGREYGFTNDEFSRRLDARIQELGIGDYIWFAGDRANDIPELLRAADIFVLPSREEGLGLALIEAMATGLPCIICDQPWVPDNLIYNGENGLICLPTPTSIADSVVALLTNQHLAYKMGACARAYIEENHNPDTLSEKLLELYRSSIPSCSNGHPGELL